MTLNKSDIVLLYILLGALTYGGLLLLSSCFAAEAQASEVSAAPLDGKEVFLTQKCNTCHTVSIAGIERTGTAIKAPDVVNVTTRHAEKDWVRKFLRKEVEHTSCAASDKARPHMKKFEASKEDEDALVTWVESQKK